MHTVAKEFTERCVFFFSFLRSRPFVESVTRFCVGVWSVS